MKPLKLFEGLTQNEKRVISSVLILIIFLLLFVNSYDFGSFDGSQNQIGKIEELNNNTRIKSKKNVLWRNAQRRQGLHVGDKVFTGKKSSAKIVIGKKSSFSLGENSLVEFQKFNKEQLINFKNGTYRVFSDGNFKMAINGKKAEIDADNSEFEIVVSGTNDVKIKTIKGGGKIKINNEVVQLDKEKPAQPTLTAASEIKKENIQLDIPHFVIDYNPLLYDEYRRENGMLKNYTPNVQVVKTPVRIPLPTSSFTKAVQVQHSPKSNFSSSFEYNIFQFDKRIHKAFIGDNYWRYKTFEQPWSDAHSFTVQKVYPAHSRPELSFSTAPIYLLQKSISANFTISSPYENFGYIVETSATGDFDNDSKISWHKQKTISLNISKTGALFFRARCVDKDMKLSDWSEKHTFNVLSPPDLQPIQLQVSAKTIRMGESTYSRWNEQSHIKKYRFHVRKGDKNIISVPLSATGSDWFPKSTGEFQISVTATDSFGRSIVSNTESVTVLEPFILTQVKPVERELSSDLPLEDAPLEDSADEPLDLSTRTVLTPPARNTLYTHSYLNFTMSHLSSKSFPLSEVTTNLSTSASLAVDYLYWYNRHGLQALLQQSLIPLSSGLEQNDFLSAEARYRFRLAPNEINNFFRSFQLSAFLGYELQQNSNATYFVKSYNFYKTGLVIDVPVFDRFVFSGTSVYGTGPNGNKVQVGWDILYFMKTRMGLGIGYKLNYIEAVDPEQFPAFLKYTESFAQGNMNFRYYF